LSEAMVTSLPLPAGLPLDAASWAQTPFVLCQVVLQLVEVIQQQHTTIQPLEARIQPLEARIAELEARVQQRSRNSDRPPSSDSPYEKRPARAGTQGKPDAKPGHRGHQQALLAPTEVIEVKPEACACGQTEFPATTPYYPPGDRAARDPEGREAHRPARDLLPSGWPPPHSRASYGVALRLVYNWHLA
jgi:Family of unknown function (DUF6444)